MKKVGVIGAVTMGQGIANAFATNGYDVTVCDIKLEWAQGGIDKIGKNKEDIAAERNNKFTHTLDSCYEMQRYKII